MNKCNNDKDCQNIIQPIIVEICFSMKLGFSITLHLGETFQNIL